MRGVKKSPDIPVVDIDKAIEHFEHKKRYYNGCKEKVDSKEGKLMWEESINQLSLAIFALRDLKRRLF